MHHYFSRPPGWTEAIRVQATPVGLSTSGAAVDRVGALVFKGGLVLTSSDKRFGGLSGLQVSADGRRLRAVSDEGSWLEARLEYDERGFLTGLSEAELKPPLTMDNFEGLALRQGQDGETLVYFLSDDNFSSAQRTLLLMFALAPQP